MGAERPELYMEMLLDKKVGVVANQTSILPSENIHLVDYLLSEGIEIKKVFVPEHGLRGKADAGELVDNSKDIKTGLPIISLYGKNKKPTVKQLEDIDIIVFDLQDVGVRFFTYISTMHYVMEAVAENSLEILILDRPNPNGDYVDGPILKEKFKSFVGMHPIPIVHGLTVGELAGMINGELWLKNQIKANLSVIAVKNWDHSIPYHLPIKPSPNLPSELSIRLYPSTCLFEGTNISVGRGTLQPFEVYGYPDKRFGNFTFTPVSIDGMAKTPRYEDQTCYGVDLRNEPITSRFTLSYLIHAYQKSPNKISFFTSYFNLLAGTDELKEMIKNEKSAIEIRNTWKNDLDDYKNLRKKYLIYD